MEYLIEYGMFLAKVATIALALIFILTALASAGNRQRKGAAKGHIKVTKLNEHIDEMLDSLKKAVLDKHSLKQEHKEKKKQHKEEEKASKARKKQTENDEQDQKKRVYVLNFKGDIAAHAVSSLREEITAVLALARESGATEEETSYRYSHDYEGGFVPQAYLPEGRRYYEPTDHGLEKRIRERLDHWRAQFEAEQ